MSDELDVIGGNAREKLRSLVSRIESLNEDKAAVMADIKEVYAEVKGEGFATKIVRAAVRERARDRAKAAEEAALLDLYMTALGENGE